MRILTRACLNCGHSDGDKLERCPVCNAVFYKLGFIEGKKLDNMNGIQRVQWVEKKIGHPIPDELNALREEYWQKQSLEYDERKRKEQYAMVAAIISGGGNKVACFYCHSTNVSKIGVMNRVGSAEVWGLGSDKIGKQFHCNNCGANF